MATAGPGLPANGVQRGSLNPNAGDPLTPGWAAVEGAERLELEDVDLPKIPVHPISADSAKKILEQLGGTPVAELAKIEDDSENPEDDANKVRATEEADWQGGFTFPYTIGPGANMRMDVLNLLERRPIYNVIARIEGHSEQDRTIILGTLRDAWVPPRPCHRPPPPHPHSLAPLDSLLPGAPHSSLSPSLRACRIPHMRPLYSRET